MGRGRGVGGPALEVKVGGVRGACVGCARGMRGAFVGGNKCWYRALAPLYYPDTLVNPDTCLGIPFLLL